MSNNALTKRRSTILINHLAIGQPKNIDLAKLKELSISPFLRSSIKLKELSVYILTKSFGFASASGPINHGVSFLFSTQWLFEVYVRTIIQREFNHQITGGSKPLIESKESPAINQFPDVVSKKKQKIYIHDAKWKRFTNPQSVSSNDLRQLYIYSKMWSSDESYLVYPTEKESIQCHKITYPHLDNQGRYFLLEMPLNIKALKSAASILK